MKRCGLVLNMVSAVPQLIGNCQGDMSTGGRDDVQAVAAVERRSKMVIPVQSLMLSCFVVHVSVLTFHCSLHNGFGQSVVSISAL